SARMQRRYSLRGSLLPNESLRPMDWNAYWWEQRVIHRWTTHSRNSASGLAAVYRNVAPARSIEGLTEPTSVPRMQSEPGDARHQVHLAWPNVAGDDWREGDAFL